MNFNEITFKLDSDYRKPDQIIERYNLSLIELTHEKLASREQN